jgi:phosphoribosylanthranilate isomerase
MVRSVRVKICGITNVEDAATAVQAGADALGFVFYRPGARYVDPFQAGKIVRDLPPFTVTLGIFVNEDFPFISEVMNITGIDFAQIHGDCVYPPSFSQRIIKAVAFDENFPRGVDQSVRAVLVDTKVPGEWGGTGVPLNWGLLAEKLKDTSPSFRDKLILAGGLTPENVRVAIGAINPYAVDVSSGVEIEPGRKDARKIKEFINAVRQA